MSAYKVAEFNDPHSGWVAYEVDADNKVIGTRAGVGVNAVEALSNLITVNATKLAREGPFSDLARQRGEPIPHLPFTKGQCSRACSEAHTYRPGCVLEKL
jgi:DNA gyrase/topoisomerase IV subunit B